MSTNDRRVRVHVENEGAGAPVMRRLESRDRIVGGLGLYLVDTLADSWGVDAGTDTTAVWFEHGLRIERD